MFSGKGIDGETGDIIKALAVIETELNKLSKSQKQKFDQVMMTGNGEMSGGFLSTLLGSIGIPIILKALTGSGLHNTPYDTSSYKTHRQNHQSHKINQL